MDTVSQLHIIRACEYTIWYISTVTGLRAGQPFPISSSNTHFSSSLPRLVNSLRSPDMTLTTEPPSGTQTGNVTERINCKILHRNYRCSLLTQCHAAPRYPRECNFSYDHRETRHSQSRNPKMIGSSFFLQVFYSEFHQNWTIDVESADRNVFTPSGVTKRSTPPHALLQSGPR